MAHLYSKHTVFRGLEPWHIALCISVYHKSYNHLGILQRQCCCVGFVTNRRFKLHDPTSTAYYRVTTHHFLRGVNVFGVIHYLFLTQFNFAFFDWKCSYTTAEENYWRSGKELREYFSGATEENMPSHELWPCTEKLYTDLQTIN